MEVYFLENGIFPVSVVSRVESQQNIEGILNEMGVSRIQIW